MTQATLDSAASVGREKLSGLVEIDEEEDIEALGIVVWSTTGNLLVPKDWLAERWETLNLPEDLYPSDVWPSSIYKRTISYLEDHELKEKFLQGHKVKFRIENGEEYVRHLYADIYYPEEEIGETGGEWRSRKLGFFDYDDDNEKLEYNTEVSKGLLGKEWHQIVGKAQGLHREIGNSFNGLDLSGVIRDVVKEHTMAVPLRTAGVIYFLPSRYAGMMDKFSALWNQMNEYKVDGKRTEIVTLPVIDSDSHRSLVKSHAEELINSRVESVVDAAIKRLSEREEETAEEIAKSVLKELSSTTEIASEYSTLLETELSVKRHLESYLDSLEGEKEKLVNAVVKEVEI